MDFVDSRNNQNNSGVKPNCKQRYCEAFWDVKDFVEAWKETEEPWGLRCDEFCESLEESKYFKLLHFAFLALTQV